MAYRRVFRRFYKKKNYRGRYRTARKFKKFNYRSKNYSLAKKRLRIPRKIYKSLTRFQRGVPLSTIKIFRSEQSRVYELTNFTQEGHGGHTPSDCYLGDMITDSDLSWCSSNYRYWNLLETTHIVKIDRTNNLVKYTNNGAPMTNFPYQYMSDPNSAFEFYVGFFKDGTTQSIAGTLDPDTQMGRAQTVHSGYYRKLIPRGKPVIFKWRNTPSHAYIMNGLPSEPSAATTLDGRKAAVSTSASSGPIRKRITGEPSSRAA